MRITLLTESENREQKHATEHYLLSYLASHHNHNQCLQTLLLSTLNVRFRLFQPSQERKWETNYANPWHMVKQG